MICRRLAAVDAAICGIHSAAKALAALRHDEMAPLLEEALENVPGSKAMTAINEIHALIETTNPQKVSQSTGDTA